MAEQLKPATPHPIQVLKGEHKKTLSTKENAAQAIESARRRFAREQEDIDAQFSAGYDRAEAAADSMVQTAEQTLAVADDKVSELIRQLAAARAEQSDAKANLKATRRAARNTLQESVSGLQKDAERQIGVAAARMHEVVSEQKAAVRAEKLATVVHLAEEVREEVLFAADGVAGAFNAGASAVTKIAKSIGHIAAEGAKEGWQKETAVTKIRRKEPSQNA